MLPSKRSMIIITPKFKNNNIFLEFTVMQFLNSLKNGEIDCNTIYFVSKRTDCGFDLIAFFNNKLLFGYQKDEDDHYLREISDEEAIAIFETEHLLITADGQNLRLPELVL